MPTAARPASRLLTHHCLPLDTGHEVLAAAYQPSGHYRLSTCSFTYPPPIPRIRCGIHLMHRKVVARVELTA